MKLAICTLTGAPDDVAVWSGTPAYFVHALRRQGTEPALVGPLSQRALRVADLVSRVTGRLGYKVNWESEPHALEHFTRAMRRQLRGTDADAVLTMGWYPMGLRATDPPCIYWGDATIGQRLGTQPHWSGLSPRTRRLAVDTESRALRDLAGIFMPSTWALQDTLDRYALDETRVRRVPFGANIDDPGPDIRRAAPSTPLRLLAVGVQWHRKGLDLAVEAVDALVARGISVTMDVVGATPPDASWTREYITYHGFLSKTLAVDSARLDSMYRQANVFLLPTRHDPFPMVLAEAAAYSLPIVSAAVGGVPDRVEKGGLLLAPGSKADDFADAVLQVADPSVYLRYCEGARSDYLTRSSWDASARTALDFLNDLPSSAGQLR